MSEGAAPSSGASSGAPTSTPSAGSAPASTPSTPQSPGGSGGSAAPKAAPAQQPSAAAPKTAAQTAEEKRYKRLINGQPVELSRSEAIETVFGTVGDDEVLDLASLRRASHERMQEAARVRKERDEAIAKLKGERGFSEWLSLHGQEGREAALRQIEAEMTQEYQRSLMTPEQQELARTKAELERLRGEHQKREEAEKAAKRQQQATAFRERFASDVKAQCKQLGLAPTPQVIAAFAAHAEQSLRSRQPVDVAAIARVVQREVDEGWSAFLGGLDDDALDTRLGDRLEKIAARRAARLSQATPKPGAPVSAPVRGKPPAQAPRDEGGRFAPQNGAPLSLEARFRALEEQRRR